MLVPAWRRPETLARCLKGLAVQQRPADEVIVVLRGGDPESLAVTARSALPGLRTVNVETPGQVAALNRGLEATTGDIVAITDDDAVPRPDWLARVVDHFEQHPEIQGVGGRDHIHGSDGAEEAEDVGRIQLWGRAVGNHHVGIGPPRFVDVLKGANMAYRRRALESVRFDPRLRGRGAQVHNDMAVALTLRRRGASLLYDPSIAVDHFLAARFDADQRGAFDPEAKRDAAHNETLVLLEYLPGGRRSLYGVWALFIGTRDAPGILMAVATLRNGPGLRRILATLRGRVDGWGTYRRTRCSGG